MCGIAGIVRLTPQAPPADHGEALRMAERLRHRGPDALTAWTSPSGRCSLGHARLEVIDLESGDQPMSEDSGEVHVVFNGEIYNFQSLRRELTAAGHRFRTRSDTEVLVHGYREWGSGLVERIEGMFAFAVWDEAAGDLLLARDRSGKKPLFWTRVGDRLAFASEVKALTTLAWVPGELDADAIPYYLTFGYVPAPRTFYQGIRALPPAHSMTVESSQDPGRGGVPEPRRYWSLDWRPTWEGSEADARTRLRALLGEAVDKRLVADVPLGAFLSGGIDSTVVVGLMSERVSGPIRTFSLGFADDPTYDETAYARMAAERFGTDHTEFTVQADAVDLVDELVDAYDEPFGDSSAIPTHIVSRLTREHVTVALTGDGGDEVFGGYARFLAMAAAGRMPSVFAALGKAVAARLPHHPDFRHPTRRFAQFFEAATLGPEERMLRWIGFFGDLDDVLAPGVARPSREALLESLSAPWQGAGGSSDFTRAMAMTMATYLPEDLLVKADRCSMAHGLELRSPCLDTAVVEFAAALPDRFRARGFRPGTLKYLLRTTFADLLPPAVLRRPKMGFGVPLPAWFRNQWRPLFEARVLARDARIFQWVRRGPIQALWDEHLGGGADHGHRLWALLTFETWLRGR